ncbi:MAG: YwqG family protein [Proteiniphilum sp.]|nr:YwqG family protein [Proteiniphilum sp.]
MPYEIVIQDPVEQVAPGTSYFWDAPQLPPELSYPFFKDEAGQPFPYTFICQINCADLQSGMPEESLPEQGMLYFFGDIDYFLGYTDSSSHGLGRWDKGVCVLYADVADHRLVRYNPFSEEETVPPHPAMITFQQNPGSGHRIGGLPYEVDVLENFPKGWQLLFQLDCDENEQFNLQFYDMGLLYFMIEGVKLKKRDFSGVTAFLTSM